MTGRWETVFRTGTAAMSRVLRVAVSKVRMPRSHRMISGLPAIAITCASEVALRSRRHATLQQDRTPATSSRSSNA